MTVSLAQEIKIKDSVAVHVLQEIMRCGVEEMCICPGNRNSFFISLVKHLPALRTHYFYDERSAAFFALGRSRATGRPVALNVTSGTATSHLMAATMEAYYTGVPLVLITADRPRSHRGCNTPQACEQKGLYLHYTPTALDLAHDEPCDLSQWDRRAPVHLNVCLEDPKSHLFPKESPFHASLSPHPKPEQEYSTSSHDILDAFLEKHQRQHLFVIVGGLKPSARAAVKKFLLDLQAPVFLEGISGLREDPDLQPLAIKRTHRLWEPATQAHYPIDAVLRIGGVPTMRLWRDLEERENTVQVLSLNDVPFSGLCWGTHATVPLDIFFSRHRVCHPFHRERAQRWLEADALFAKKLQEILLAEPTSEPGLVHALSKLIPSQALVFIGNSLPIREWDLAATRSYAHSNVYASRGLLGIDGQTSTFAGLCSPTTENWAMIGDLTALHDLSGPWIFSQLPDITANLAVINNGGGKLFERISPDKDLQNCHHLSFAPVAELWGLRYEQWHAIPEKSPCRENRLIEIIPDDKATERFYERYVNI